MSSLSRNSRGQFSKRKQLTKDDLDSNVIQEGRNNAKAQIEVEKMLNVEKPTLLPRDPNDIGIKEFFTKEDTPILKTYHIYHSVDDNIGLEMVKGVKREYIGTITAPDLEQAFYQSTHKCSDYKTMGENLRDTMVGDVLCDDYGFYMICSDGTFKLIAVLDEQYE